MTQTDRAISAAVSTMVGQHDVANTLSHLLHACCAAYPAESVALLVRAASGELELLSASNHDVEGIELLQIQSQEGPCAEVIGSDRPVIVSGAAALVERWPEVGPAIVAAGFDAAHAYPMRWRGHTIGGLNIFLRAGATVDESVGQLIADLATLAVLQSDDLSLDQLVARVHEAVAARAIIEQASGVLAHRERIDVNQAHVRLLEIARTTGVGLSAAASQVLTSAYESPDERSPGYTS